MIFNLINGGSSGSIDDAYAVVSVTYPEGSTCICTKSDIELRAPNTSGNVMFGLPEGGTWTISCRDGAQSASDTVTVSQYGVYSKTLTYQVIPEVLYIFKSGEGVQTALGDYTGTVTTGGVNYTPAVTNDYITLAPSQFFVAVVTGTNSTVSVSGYSAMHCLFDSWSLTGSEDLIRVGYTSSKTFDTSSPPAGSSPSNGSTTSGTNTEVIVNLPSSGSYYFYAYVTTSYARATISNWWLE